MSSFLEPIARTSADVLSPLRLYFSSREELQLFLNRFGWDVNLASGDVNAINTAFAIEPLITTLIDRVDKFVNGTDEERLRATLDVIQAAKNAVDHLSNLNGGGGGLSAPFNQPAFWSELSGALIEDLIVTLLEQRHPVFFASFHLFGVIRFERLTPGGAGRIPYTRSRIDWAMLSGLLTRPGEQLNELYKWNVSGQSFDHQKLFRAIERALLALHVPVAVTPPRKELQKFIDPVNIEIQGLYELEAPILDTISTSDDSRWRIGFVAMPIPDPLGSTGLPRGLLLMPLLAGDLSLTTYFSPSVGMKITGAVDGTGSFIAKIYPDKSSFETNLATTVVDFSLELFGKPSEPFLLIGSRNGSRLELDGFRALVGFRGAIVDPEIYFSLGTGDLDSKLRLKVLFSEEADGFVQNVVGGEEGAVIELGANLLFSSKHGVSFEGSGALDFSKYIHLVLGPISVETIYIRAVADSDGLRTDLGIGLKGSLGPLNLVVENIGVQAKFLPVNGGGTFGNLDIRFGFKPPNGVGLSLDTGVVKGGGYLYFDFDREEYAGVLELSIAEIVTVKAIGLITTKMPDGSKGFSLLIIITAEFGTGIQLGFGFTLIGLGGLLGLNRTMNLPPLMEGVRTGAINSIMFPENPVANAPRIISDLRLIFPPYVGKFLIGPMAKLGWGTPTLISVSLGVIIEIPGNIAILGVLKVALPAEDAPLIVIQVNFAGAIEFDKKRLYFFATLFESRVLFLTIEGDMGLLVAWGDDANFVVSVGGFHPRFNPPPLPFPSPRRIAIDILNTSVYRIRAEGYFAVTSNTVQFGSNTELMIDVGVAQVEGHITFDALFQFSPFYFIIEISAGVSLKVFGMGLFSISLQFTLEGPTPWRAHGSGSISFLFFDVSADFDVTWGDSRDTTLPPIPVMPLLKTELEKQQNWIAELPSGNNLLVSLRKLSETENSQVLHPLGTLRVSQRAVPLDIKIDKVGSQKPLDANQFKLVPSGDLVKVSDADEQFAKAQFINMSDAEKLSQRAFDPLHGGVKLASGAQTLGSAKMAKRKVRYEQIIIDNNFKRFRLRFKPFSFGFFTHFFKGSAISKSALSKNYRSQIDPFTEKLQVKDGGFTVALAENNRAYSTQAMNFSSESLAQQYIQNQVSLHPELHEMLHVIPQHEVTAEV